MPFGPYCLIIRHLMISINKLLKPCKVKNFTTKVSHKPAKNDVETN